MKKKILIGSICALVAVIAIIVAVKQITAPDVDQYCQPGFLGEQSRGYMWLRMNEAEQDATGEILLTISTGFCDSLSYAEKGRYIELYYSSTNVFDISYPGAEKCTLPDGAVGLGGEDSYYLLALPNDGVNPKDLVFKTGRWLRKIMPSTLGYTVELPLTVREDAPYECSGMIELRMEFAAEGDLSNEYTWDDSFYAKSYGYVYFYKCGDTITFLDFEDQQKKTEPLEVSGVPYVGQ